MVKIYKVFPGIGIARLGNSENDYFIGPEAPRVVPPAPYRDSTGKIKRQGARFRIYEYEMDEFGQETLLREVTADNNTVIIWSVHLVNRKAAGPNFPPLQTSDRNSGYDRHGLTIDARKQEISGVNQSFGPLSGDISFIRDNQTEATTTVKLGDLKTDEVGRLIVLGGHGLSRSPLNESLTNFANNDGWFDDVSDGPVTATVNISGETFTATPAWVVVASPSYAPDIHNMMTWYDQAISVNANFFDPALQLSRPSFTQDIYPILKRTVFLQWVSEDARRGHGTGSRGDFLATDKLTQLSDNSDSARSFREAVFNRLATPDTPAPQPERIPSFPQNMPRLYSGINPNGPTNQFVFTSLSEHQHRVITQWKDGDFDSDWSGSEASLVPFETIPVDKQPDALNRAALESCIGGPFFPGIETTYLMTLAETYSSPFRIDQSKPPGYLTERMAIPWQADFVACGALWWPAQRPVSVKVGDNFEDYSRGVSSFAGMVRHWSDLGFIVNDGDEYIETERQSIP
ncbi:LodA/GoxA family CTQ-dependent oxidase [Acaryochloris sp. IP29b_bin.137]|uniref:LodA/GoxA family CTQ-dependent oxidase n=1 Tax=Acaryochloris sp. IP29b_bin.137 TaxID=2969217 RepID=UPI00263A140C|nr:LodA/GoxA family CTQ-dependent oxidase [Acaryochloris sp. IP29b_bin.137]